MSYYCFINSESQQKYGSFETIYMDAGGLINNGWIRKNGTGNGCLVWTADEYYEYVVDSIDDYVGWYWVAGVPGCLWDGTPSGPYKSEAEAITAARE